MERCKTCKWWGKQTIISRLGLHYCNHPKIGEYDDDGFGEDCMVYPYTEGAGILSGPDFGCVHHEPNSLKTGPSIRPNN